jgi:hypothetical protein
MVVSFLGFHEQCTFGFSAADKSLQDLATRLVPTPESIGGKAKVPGIESTQDSRAIEISRPDIVAEADHGGELVFCRDTAYGSVDCRFIFDKIAEQYRIGFCLSYCHSDLHFWRACRGSMAPTYCIGLASSARIGIGPKLASFE